MNIFVEVFALIMLVQLILYHISVFKIITRILYDFSEDTKYFILKFISLFLFKLLKCSVCITFWLSLIYFQDIRLSLCITLFSHLTDLVITKLKK